MAIPLDYYNIFGQAPEGKVLNKSLADANYYFGIDDKFKLSDANRYFMDAPPVENPVDDGIGSIINQNIIPPYLIPTDENGGGDNNIIIPRSTYDENFEDELFDEDRQKYLDSKKIGIMKILQNIPTPFNLARKGLETFRKYQEKKEIERKIQEQKDIQAAIDRANDLQKLNQQMQKTGVTGKDYNQAANIAGGGGGSQVIDTPAGPMTAREATYDNDKNTGTAQSYSQHFANGGLVSLRGKI